MKNKTYLACGISLIIVLTLSLFSMSISAQQEIETAQTFAKLCGGDVGEVVVKELGDSKIKGAFDAAYKVKQGAQCLAIPTSCVGELVKGYAKNFVTSQALEVATAAIPEVAPALAAYNMVSGLVQAGSTIKEGCLDVDTKGMASKIDPFSISADKDGNAQDISSLFFGSAKITDEQKMFGKNIELSKSEGKAFRIKAKENAFVKINNKEANLADGYIDMARTEDKDGKASVNVNKADVTIGKGGAELKFGDYEGTFTEGTRVLFDAENGFMIPEGQQGKIAKIGKSQNTIKLGENGIRAKIINGKYVLEGKSFELDNMKVYAGENEVLAGITVEDTYYTKAKGTVIETRGLKIGGDELNLFNKGGQIKDYGKNYIYISEGAITLNSGKESETEVEFLEGNEFVKTNGKFKISALNDGNTLARIAQNEDGKMGILIDPQSSMTITNGQEGMIVANGKLLQKAASVCKGEAECKEYGKTTPAEIVFADGITAKEMGIEAAGQIKHVVNINEDSYDVCSSTTSAPKSSTESVTSKVITGQASAGEWFASAKKYAKECKKNVQFFLLGEKPEPIGDKYYNKIYGKTRELTPVQGKTGIEYEADAETIIGNHQAIYTYDKDGNHIATRMKYSGDEQWGEKKYVDEEKQYQPSVAISNIPSEQTKPKYVVISIKEKDVDESLIMGAVHATTDKTISNTYKDIINKKAVTTEDFEKLKEYLKNSEVPALKYEEMAIECKYPSDCSPGEECKKGKCVIVTSWLNKLKAREKTEIEAPTSVAGVRG